MTNGFFRVYRVVSTVSLWHRSRRQSQGRTVKYTSCHFRLCSLESLGQLLLPPALILLDFAEPAGFVAVRRLKHDFVCQIVADVAES